jgi:glycosyltransferase involved in cell wall biosynthesis
MHLNTQKKIAVIIFQNMHAYHHARFNAIKNKFNDMGTELIALEISTKNYSYGNALDVSSRDSVITLFKEINYLTLTNKNVVKAVYKKLQELSPDLIFSPAPAFSEGAAAFKYKLTHKTQLVMMDDVWERTSNDSLLKKKIKQLIYKIVDGFFLPSQLHGDFFNKFYKIPYSKQRYFYDVVDNRQFKQIETIHGTNNISIHSYKKVVFVGRLIKRKNISTLIHALSILTDTSIRLIIVGDGPEKNTLYELANKLNVFNRIDWQGSINNGSIKNILQEADVVVVPSQFEQWGLIVNESWAAGALVVGTDAVGALKSTRNPITDWMMVPVNEIEMLAKAIDKALNLSKDERSSLVKLNSDLADKYNLNSHVQSAVDFLNSSNSSRTSIFARIILKNWHGRIVTW